MGAMARKVSLAAGGDVVPNNDGAERILAILQDYFATGAVDSVYQEVARSLRA